MRNFAHLRVNMIMGIFSLKLSNQIAHLRANMIMRIFFSETVQSDDLFFFGENGEEALVENGDTYSTAVDDEHDLDLIYE